MSITLGAGAYRVRQLLGDTDPDNFCVSSPVLWRSLADKGREWAPRAGYYEAWTTNVLSLSNTGSSDFAFALGTVYQNVAYLKSQSDRRIIRRWGRSAIEAARDSDAANTADYPVAFYLMENSGNRLYARFWPRPAHTETLDALTTAVPQDSAIVTDTLDLSPVLVSAIVKSVAAAMIQGMDEETVARLKIGPGESETMEREAQALLVEEMKRQHGLKRADGVALAWRG